MLVQWKEKEKIRRPPVSPSLFSSCFLPLLLSEEDRPRESIKWVIVYWLFLIVQGDEDSDSSRCFYPSSLPTHAPGQGIRGSFSTLVQG